ncbi:uncharacterized protein BP01DRAFT_132408 [Aspergillus saccharolyticus JOP 1030-1]|uniref:Uncharacterized protein n=1 Tax=Aspergillus saccharolyticus JOP 1030-1 TaxID=1450539 RepID=A0A318Z6A0_9EURO|nr:hypothetical protein BP01DRAFT_132408 [Aspergillus saccharolyticus JOP 1030-1]PYH42666.1 hypothetical protein BP01DRAFT_132408 [Aspergillus saccharolyticus JOP 1030-1]
MSPFTSIASWLCCIPSHKSAPSAPRDSYPAHQQPVHPTNTPDNEGYLPPTPPLPAYTPHPHTLTEKTLALHPRPSSASLNEKSAAATTSTSEPASSVALGSAVPPPAATPYAHPYPTAPPAAPTPPPAPSYPPYYHNSTSRLFDPDDSSDTSSTLSFPSTSSYGNTSTATRETPPPPYSPRSLATGSRTMSPVPSLMSDSGRSSSSSNSSSSGGSVVASGVGRSSEEMVQIAAPRPVVVWDGRTTGRGWGDLYD